MGLAGLFQGGTDGTFSFTFEEPGTYEYFCGPHEDVGMVGTVTVTGGTASASAGAETLTDTGGPSLALAAVVLLVGLGLLSFAVLRRRNS